MQMIKLVAWDGAMKRLIRSWFFGDLHCSIKKQTLNKEKKTKQISDSEKYQEEN